MFVRRFIILFLASVAIVSVMALRVRPQIEAVEVGVDDANIFFVYARNLAAGHGFVWNTGGPRVEGFSSPLWLLLITPFFAAHSSPELSLFLLSAVLVSAALAIALTLFVRCFRQDDEQHGPYLLIAFGLGWLLWCFAQPLFLLWTTLTLMETGLWCAVVMVGTVITAWCVSPTRGEKPPWPLWVLIPLMLLARPEGMMWAGTLIAAETALQWISGKPIRRWLRHTALSLAVYGLALGALTAFRLAYFGYPLPNTYYAKVSPDRLYTLTTGWEYFSEFLLSHRALPFLAILVAVIALWFAGRTLHAVWVRLRNKSPAQPRFPMAAAYVASMAALCGLIAPILVGGDHFDGFRFYQPIWPTLALPLIFLLCDGFNRATHAYPLLRTRGPSLTLSLVALALLGWFFKPDVEQWRTVGRRRVVDEFRLARDGRALGESLNRIFADTLPEIGAIAVGGVKFAYHGPVNDLMGLSNIEMAHHPGPRKGIKNHAAFSKDVFYKQQPPVMVPVALPFRARHFVNGPMPQEFSKYIHHRWVLEPLQGLPRETAFRERYTPALVSRADQLTDECIGAFYRNDFLASLRTNDMYEVASFDL